MVIAKPLQHFINQAHFSTMRIHNLIQNELVKDKGLNLHSFIEIIL